MRDKTFGLTVMFLAGVLAHPSQANPLPPDAMSDVFAGANGQRSFFNAFHGTTTVSAGACIDFAGDLGIACGFASAGTLGFFPPSVVAPGLLSNLGRADAGGDVWITPGPQTGVAVRADASARLLYYVEVIARPSAPANAVVPIDVGFGVRGSGHVTGGGFNTFAQIAVSVNGFNMGGAFTESVGTNASRSGVRTLFIDTGDSIPDLLLIDLQVSGGVAVGDSPTFPNPIGSFSATADPTFQIDPDYAFRDYFDLTYSPNLAPAAVPEPNTVLLVCAGALGLLGYHRRRRVPLLVIAAALCAFAVGKAWAQAPEPAILDIEWENSVAYFDDVADAVNGNPAEVLNKIGWPGTTDTYRVDIRVPDGTAPGISTVQLTFISGREVSLPVQ
jgi:hypothetical protein